MAYFLSVRIADSSRLPVHKLRRDGREIASAIIGISIHFGAVQLAIAAVVMVSLIYAMRIVLTRLVFRAETYSLRDAAITTMMAPKGLAAVVLAALPLQYGVAGGEVIRDTIYMVVLVSIMLTALLVMAYPLPAMQKLYGRALGKKQSPDTSSASD